MNKKRKAIKSNSGKAINGESLSSCGDESSASLANGGSASSHSSIDKTEGIWKRRPILLGASVFIIVALIVGGALVFQYTAKDNAPSNAIPDVPSPGAGKIEIRDVTVTDIVDKSLTVKWKTNVPATSELMAYEQNGTNSVGGWPDNKLVLDHKIILEKLTPSTAYNLKIKSKDAAGNEAVFESNNPYKTRAPSLTTDITAGKTSPDFSLTAITGENISLADYQGKKVMLVFWMMSCSSCRDELPHLRDFWESSQHNDLVLLAINIGENETLIKNYVISQKLTFPVLLDQDSAVSKKYTIVRYPTIFLLAPDKTVIKVREEPFKNVGEIEDFIRSAN